MRIANLLLILVWLAPAVAAHGTSVKDIDEAMSYDGLQKINVPGIELAYALPDVSLAGYRRVKLEPVEVSFRKDWNPRVPGSTFKLSAKDRERVRTRAKAIFQEAFVKELETNGGYAVVNTTGPDVLRVTVIIANLYVTAPDVMTSGRTHVFTVSPGEATLVAELADSETGAVLARVIDRREARSVGPMHLSNSVTNAEAGREVATKWAHILRNALDRAHGIGGH